MRSLISRLLKLASLFALLLGAAQLWLGIRSHLMTSMFSPNDETVLGWIMIVVQWGIVALVVYGLGLALDSLGRIERQNRALGVMLKRLQESPSPVPSGRYDMEQVYAPRPENVWKDTGNDSRRLTAWYYDKNGQRQYLGKYDPARLDRLGEKPILKYDERERIKRRTYGRWSPDDLAVYDPGDDNPQRKSRPGRN